MATRKKKSDALPRSYEDFVEGAARAFWADEYMRQVDELPEAQSKALSPGPGGEWLNVLPPIPPSARRDGDSFSKRFLRSITEEDMEAIVDKLSSDDAGWYAAMQAMGHGVGLGDYGLDIEVPRWEPSADVHADAQYAIAEELSEWGE